MADTQETAVKITGDAASAVAAMKQASDAVSGGVASMKGALENIGGAFAKVQAAFAGLAAVVAGGAFFKAAIGESNKLTGETMRLAKTLGVTVEQATTLNTALGDIGADSDTYIGAFQRFAQQLRRNEEGLQAMGLKTRDANGNLREANDVFSEAIATVGAYKPGLDQTTAAQKLFGKSIDDVMKLQKLNNDVLEEAKRKNEELGLIITDQNVEASKAYKDAMNDVGDVMSAVMKTIGDAVMPAFTELAQYLASTGPYVINVFKGALTGLMLVFRGVQAVVKTVAAVIFEFISYTIDQLGNLSEMIGAVLSGDFARAGTAAVAMKDRMVGAFRNVKDAAVDAFSTASGAFGDDLNRLWGPKTAATKAGPGKGTRTMSEGDMKAGPEDKNLSLIESQLAAKKVEYAMENDLREMSKAQELATWQELLTQYSLTEKEKVTAAKKTSEMRLGVLRDERQQSIALKEEEITAYKAAQLDVLAATKAEAQFRVDTQQMTKLEMLALDQQLEDERFRITKEAVEARLALLATDPTKNAVALAKLNDELAAVEREHLRNQRAINMDSQKEQLKDWQGMFNSIGSTFANTVTGLVMRTMTLGQAVKSLFSSVLSTVVSFIAQMLAKKLAAWAVEKTMASGTIATNAGVAASGAAASQASIPWVGPVLALAAMAAVFAAVMGMKSSSTASARGGFDIPAGMNPMTQLHEQEMVLPKEQADSIRAMSNGGGAGAPVVIKGTSAGDFLIAHKSELGKLLKSMNRNFEFQ